MKPITKLYIKTFFFLGISYGLMMSLFDILDGSGFNLWKFLFSTFFFGTFMSLFLVSYHRYRLREIGIYEITDDNIGVHQSRIIQTKYNISDIIAKLKSDPKIGKMEMREFENGILLKSGMSWHSFGENIKILPKVNSDHNHDFEYQISSSPKFIGTLVDYGVNIENINKVEYAIKSIG